MLIYILDNISAGHLGFGTTLDSPMNHFAEADQKC